MKRRSFLALVGAALTAAAIASRRTSPKVASDAETIERIVRRHAPYAEIPAVELRRFALAYAATDGWRLRGADDGSAEQRERAARFVVGEALLACGFFTAGGAERLRYRGTGAAGCRNPWARV